MRGTRTAPPHDGIAECSVLWGGTGANSGTKERNGRAAHVGSDKGRSQVQLAQLFAALGLVHFQYKDNAERATSVEKQHRTTCQELGVKTSGTATLATVLAVEGGRGSVLQHTSDPSCAFNTLPYINTCSISVLQPCCCIGKLYDRKAQRIKLKSVKSRNTWTAMTFLRLK